MFDKLLSWLREKARLWFGEDTPINVSVSAPMESAITLWAQMYDTGGPWCHGGKDPLHSLGLPQSIAAELARLTTLEMECLVSGSARADSINELLKPFIADLRIPVEYGCALGGVLFRPYLAPEGHIQIDVVQGDCFCPTRFDRGYFLRSSGAGRTYLHPAGKPRVFRRKIHRHSQGVPFHDKR